MKGIEPTKHIMMATDLCRDISIDCFAILKLLV